MHEFRVFHKRDSDAIDWHANALRRTAVTLYLSCIEAAGLEILSERSGSHDLSTEARRAVHHYILSGMAPGEADHSAIS